MTTVHIFGAAAMRGSIRCVDAMIFNVMLASVELECRGLYKKTPE